MCDPGLYPTWAGFPGIRVPQKHYQDAAGMGSGSSGLHCLKGVAAGNARGSVLPGLAKLEFGSLAFVPWNASC